MPRTKKNARKSKEANRERMRLQRQQETAEAHTNRLAHQKEYDTQQKESKSPKELDESLKQKRQMEAQRRAGMPNPIKLSWLEQKKTHEMSRRDQMPPDKKKELLDQKRTQEMSRRDQMPPDKKKEWLDQKRTHEMSRRDQMPPDKKKEWLDQKRTHEMSRIDQMPPDKKKEFLDQKRTRELSRRDQMPPDKKKELLDQKRTHEMARRHQMPTDKREAWLDQKRTHEISRQLNMPSDKKKQWRDNKTAKQGLKRNAERMHGITIEQAGKNFRKTLADLPEYVCTCCHRLLWKRSVQKFDKSKYDMASEVVQQCFAKDIMYETRPGEIYICSTCNASLKCKHPTMPAQAVANGLRLQDIPAGLEQPNDMERMTFRKKIPFMKLGALGRGRQWRIQGPCVNVPANLEPVCNLLPRLPNEAMLVPVKLKRRLCYKGHYMYEAIRPSVALAWILWLKQNNPHYSDVEIQLDFCNLMTCYERRGKSLVIKSTQTRGI